jgi:hypothetical protein
MMIATAVDGVILLWWKSGQVAVTQGTEVVVLVTVLPRYC